MTSTERKRRILVVEDDDQTRQQVTEYFQNAGYETRYARSGGEGFDAVSKEPDFDFILTDYNMLPMNGLDMIDNIKSKIPACKAVFVVLSTEKDSDLTRRSKQLGVKLWMLKPFDGPTLNDTLKLLMKRGLAAS